MHEQASASSPEQIRQLIDRIHQFLYGKPGWHASPTVEQLLTDCVALLRSGGVLPQAVKGDLLASRMVVELRESLRTRLLFGNFDEPIDDAGVRLLRVIIDKWCAWGVLPQQNTEDERTEETS